MPTRTQQCDILEARLRLARRHQARLPVPARSGRVLLLRARGVRSRRAAADAGARDVGSRHRHERLDVPRSQVGRQLRSRSRQGARRRKRSSKLEKFHRYLDVDGDGIPYRTLPGVHPKGAYFTRGSGHTQYGAYTEDSAEYQIVLDRLTRKFHTAKRLVPKAVIEQDRAHRHRAWWPTAAPTARCARRSTSSRSTGIKANYMRAARVPVRRGSREIPRAAQAGVRRSSRTATRRCARCSRSRPRWRRRSCARSCTTAACRSPRSSSSKACSPRSNPRPASPKPSPGNKLRRCRMTFLPKPKVRHPVAAEERARAHAPRLRRRHVDAVRRLRPRLASPPRSSRRPGVSTSSRRTW